MDAEIKMDDIKMDLSEDKQDRKESLAAVLSLDDGPEADVIQLVSQFSVPRKVAMQSELIHTMAEGDQDAKEFPLPNVKTAVLRKVVDYLSHHVDAPAPEIEKPLKSANMAEVVQQWDADYSDVDQDLLFELILAANYLDVKPLLDLCCARVASMIKGKTPEQIRKTFNIVNDFTPEEEEAVRNENKWAEEV